MKTLLSEYALTPGVFEEKPYSSEEVADLYLQKLKEVMLEEGLVRDLRNGKWREAFNNENISLHARGKELLKKLIKQNRLRSVAKALPNEPMGDNGWCEEALASHYNLPLQGIITVDQTKLKHEDSVLVSSIQKLNNALWWRKRESSVRLQRTVNQYLKYLDLILDCSNSIMFIDPYIDPQKYNYRAFRKIIERIANRKRLPLPLVEIHRKCFEGLKMVKVSEWEKRFKEFFSVLDDKIKKKIEVFIWDDLHDRYIISDLIGISLPYGLGTTKNPRSITTWTRLSRSSKDHVQREFDENCREYHKLRGKFCIL